MLFRSGACLVSLGDKRKFAPLRTRSSFVLVRLERRQCVLQRAIDIFYFGLGLHLVICVASEDQLLDFAVGAVEKITEMCSLYNLISFRMDYKRHGIVCWILKAHRSNDIDSILYHLISISTAPERYRASRCSNERLLAHV